MHLSVNYRPGVVRCDVRVPRLRLRGTVLVPQFVDERQTVRRELSLGAGPKNLLEQTTSQVADVDAEELRGASERSRGTVANRSMANCLLQRAQFTSVLASVRADQRENAFIVRGFGDRVLEYLYWTDPTGRAGNARRSPA